MPDLATLLNAIGVLVNGTVIPVASRIGGALVAHRGFHRASQHLLGTVFSGLAVKLAFDRRG